MPKIVDASVRRQEVIDAVWRIVLRDGVEAASLRRVADEAGLAIGSVRHYFVSHEELLGAAAQAMVDRLAARIEDHVAAVDESTDRRTLATELLEELLPLDRRRADEVGLWLAFSAAARTNPALEAQARQIHLGSRTLARKILHQTPLRDDEAEIEYLCIVVDGLSLAGVLQPGSLTPGRIREVLARHLDGVQQRAAEAVNAQSPSRTSARRSGCDKKGE